jgi:hypothetical protein
MANSVTQSKSIAVVCAKYVPRKKLERVITAGNRHAFAHSRLIAINTFSQIQGLPLAEQSVPFRSKLFKSHIHFRLGAERSIGIILLCLPYYKAAMINFERIKCSPPPETAFLNHIISRSLM